MKRWPWIFGIGLFLLMATSANPNLSFELFVIVAGIGSVLTILGLILGLRSRRIKREQEAAYSAAQEVAAKKAIEESRAKAEAERLAAASRREEWERTHGRIVTALAGVTFNNEDGTSRQKILRDLKASGIDGQLELEETEYKGSPAVRVLVDGECVGMVPRSHVQEVLSIMNRISAAHLDIETFRPEEEEDEDGNIRRGGELIYRADLTLVYTK